MGRQCLILLHGALGASSQFENLKPLLEALFEIHTFDFEGHGMSRLRERPLRIAHFCENLLDYMDACGIEVANIFGHSMGGQVGIYAACFFPDRVLSVFTMGTKFLWSPQSAKTENAFLQPETLLSKVPQFAQQLKDRHIAAGWENLLEKIREMQSHIGEHGILSDDDLRRISKRIRVGVGDRDRMVTIEESINVYRLLPESELQVFPRTPHPLDMISPSTLADAIRDFVLHRHP